MSAPVFAATPTWIGDFESGDVNQWSDKVDVHPGTTDRLQIVSDVVAQGNYALKATVKHGDLNNAGNRAEVVLRNPMFHQGDEVWFHWFTMFPEDYQSIDKWVLWTQWHSSGFGFPITFNLHGEELDFRVMAHEYDARGDYDGGVLWTAPLEKGKWMEFVLHVKFSDSGDGFVELWKDGEQVVPLTYHHTLDPNDYAYLKQGIYRHKEIPYDMTIYHDGMTAYADQPEEVFARWEGGAGPDEGDASTPTDPSLDPGAAGEAGCSGTDAAAAAALLPLFGLGGLIRRLRRRRK